MIHNIVTKIRSFRSEWRSRQLVAQYLKGGQKPWSHGYNEFKDQFIRSCLTNENLLQIFAASLPLPIDFGKYLDERVIEYPWLFSLLQGSVGNILDAGGALNHSYIIEKILAKTKDLTVITLEPEACNFWQQRVSYIYADLRKIPFRDNWFDNTVCISTIEHVGMDNSIYSSKTEFKKGCSEDYLLAAKELWRVTTNGGQLFMTIPFGKYIDYRWYQQFSGIQVEKILNILFPKKALLKYYQYQNGAWILSNQEDCKNCIGFNIHDTKYLNRLSDKDYDSDYAAASRAVVVMQLTK